jgi:hypothetical protein
MNTYTIKGITAGMCMLAAVLTSNTLAQNEANSDKSAKKQLAVFARDPKTIDGSNRAHGGLDRPNNPAPVSVPAVTTSSHTATTAGGSNQARQQAAINAYKSSGPAVPIQVQKASHESIHAKEPPAPVQPKPAAKPSGSVPTGGR